MGSGTRLKLLEAMAAGCAIVCTPIAATGLVKSVREELILATTAEDFTEQVARLLLDETLRRELQTSTQAVVRQWYDWDVLIPRLLQVYKDQGLG